MGTLNDLSLDADNSIKEAFFFPGRVLGLLKVPSLFSIPPSIFPFSDPPWVVWLQRKITLSWSTHLIVPLSPSSSWQKNFPFNLSTLILFTDALHLSYTMDPLGVFFFSPTLALWSIYLTSAVVQFLFFTPLEGQNPVLPLEISWNFFFRSFIATWFLLAS